MSLNKIIAAPGHVTQQSDIATSGIIWKTLYHKYAQCMEIILHIVNHSMFYCLSVLHRKDFSDSHTTSLKILK